jgi:hypothetical protein
MSSQSLTNEKQHTFRYCTADNDLVGELTQCAQCLCFFHPSRRLSFVIPALTTTHLIDKLEKELWSGMCTHGNALVCLCTTQKCNCSLRKNLFADKNSNKETKPLTGIPHSDGGE